MSDHIRYKNIMNHDWAWDRCLQISDVHGSASSRAALSRTAATRQPNCSSVEEEDRDKARSQEVDD